MINNNGIIRNDIEANIQKYYVIKINTIHTNINDSKLTFRKCNNLLKKNDFSLQKSIYNRTSRFGFLQTLSYLPSFNIMLPILSIRPNQKLSRDSYLEFKTCFILKDDEVNFFSKI